MGPGPQEKWGLAPFFTIFQIKPLQIQVFLCFRYPQSQRNVPTAKLNKKITNEMIKALFSNSSQEPTINSAQNKSQRIQIALSAQIDQVLLLILTVRNFPFSAIAHPFP